MDDGMWVQDGAGDSDAETRAEIAVGYRPLDDVPKRCVHFIPLLSEKVPSTGPVGPVGPLGPTWN